MKQYRNVQNIIISGKKCSVCEVWYAFKDDGYVWKCAGKVVCEGWYKKGETIRKKWYSELSGENK